MFNIACCFKDTIFSDVLLNFAILSEREWFFVYWRQIIRLGELGQAYLMRLIIRLSINTVTKTNYLSQTNYLRCSVQFSLFVSPQTSQEKPIQFCVCEDRARGATLKGGGGGGLKTPFSQ